MEEVDGMYLNRLILLDDGASANESLLMQDPAYARSRPPLWDPMESHFSRLQQNQWTMMLM